MPDYDRHILQADHNQELLDHLCRQNMSKKFSDWAVTVCFYTALHYVEAVVFTQGSLWINAKVRVNGKHSSEYKPFVGTGSEHMVRAALIHNNSIFNALRDAYGNLYEDSRTARYDCHSFNCNGYIDSERDLDVVKKEFVKIAPKHS